MEPPLSAPGGVRVPAPAKVNLWLRVLRRRTDGFHELDTLFQAVDLCDQVEVTRAPGGRVRLGVDGAELGPVRENLAYRAALAFLDAVGPAAGSDGVRIRLVKRIPAGAGLGGGSSDAAAVLRCMNTLWARPVAAEVLAEVGASLGSDVPFFLGGAALARGRGRGEALDELPPLPPGHLVLVLPPVHVATGAAYGALARHRAVHGAGGGGVPGEAPQGWDDVARWAVNDFEQVVPAAHAPVAASLESLRGSGARPALLSGSGAACFGAFPDEASARAAAQALTERLGWPALPVRTLTSFPEPEPF